MSNQPFRTLYASCIVCPFCGKKYFDGSDFFSGEDMEADKERECGGCKKLFQVQREVEITYSTYKIEGEK
jgi:hypothetical protein